MKYSSANIQTTNTVTATNSETSISTSTDSAPITIKLNQPLVYNNVMINVVKVLGDNRCPSNVQCIQAGTVKLLLDIDSKSGTSTMEIGLGKSIKFDNFSISLDSVSPYPITTSKILPTDYKFTLGIL